MKINKIKNIPIRAADGRATPLDVYYPMMDANLPLLIFAHGFKGYKNWGQFSMMFETIAAKGFCVVAMNFSHNGGTMQQTIDFPDLEAFSKNTYSKEQEDLKHLVDWCFSTSGRNKLPKCDFNNLNLLEHSRGGSMALIFAAANNRVKKVVTWGAVADLIGRLPDREIMEEWRLKGERYISNARTKQEMPQLYTFVEDLLENKSRFEIQTAVKELKDRELIVHGTADESVDQSHAKKLKQWNPKAKLKLIPNADHTFGGKQPYEKSVLPDATIEAIKATCSFLKED